MVQARERSGFELSPHTAGVVIHAWSSTVDGCLTEAVRGFVACFADVDTAQAPQRMVGFMCQPAPEPELLVEMLDEAIRLVEAQDVVPVRVTAIRTPEGGVAGEFGVVDSSTVEPFRPAPKAVSRHGLCAEREDGSWSCQVTVEI